MAYHSGAIEVSLAAALGDDPALIADLRTAFFEGVARHLDTVDHAASPAEIVDAASRLRSLAASFGAHRLMHALASVIETGTISPAERRRIDRAVAVMKAH